MRLWGAAGGGTREGGVHLADARLVGRVRLGSPPPSHSQCLTSPPTHPLAHCSALRAPPSLSLPSPHLRPPSISSPPSRPPPRPHSPFLTRTALSRSSRINHGRQRSLRPHDSLCTPRLRSVRSPLPARPLCRLLLRCASCHKQSPLLVRFPPANP